MMKMSNFKLIDKQEFEKLINRYKSIQSDFLNQFNAPIINPSAISANPQNIYHGVNKNGTQYVDQQYRSRSQQQQNMKSVGEILYCEPCDKEFRQRAPYEAHILTHEKCKSPGCSFSATKKV